MSLLVFKILKPSKSFHGVGYNDRKTKKASASLLHFANFGILTDGAATLNAKDAKKYLEAYSSTNNRIVHKQFHAILSCKGKTISMERLKDLGMEMLDKLGYGSNPVLVYGHNDTAHHHVHLITSRVGPDGKKIAHHFERKRANQILSGIIGINRESQWQAATKSALSYQFETVAQFKMLLEQQGYTVREINGQIELFKYGSLQTTIPLSSLQSHMNDYRKGQAAISRIRALILKYKNHYGSSLLLESKTPYPKRPVDLQSELTTKLHTLFGLQFCFFTGKGHSMPYGYMLIDHANKICYKGSEILPLSALVQTATIPEDKITTLQNRAAVASPIQPTDVPHDPQKGNSIDSPLNANISEIIDELIRESEQEAEKEVRSNMSKKRSSRRRFT